MNYYKKAWFKLKDKIYDKPDNNIKESITWEELEKIMDDIEIETKAEKLLSNIKYNEFDKNILKLLLKISQDNDSTLDYIECIIKNKNRAFISVFTEPNGLVTFIGDDITNLLDKVHNIFKYQPEDWNYIKAGDYIFDNYNQPIDINKLEISMFWNKNNNK